MAILRVPVDISWPGGGGPGVNVWHIRVNSVLLPDFPEINAALAGIRDFYAGIQGTLQNGAAWRFNGEAVAVDSTPNEFVSGLTEWEVLGGSGNALPDLLQVCVSWRTSAASRRGRGRTFVGPFTVAAMATDGSILPAFRSAVLAEAQALIDASTAANDWAVGVYSREDGIIRDIVSATVGTQFSFLSSRRD